jgi:hypothetical protein
MMMMMMMIIIRIWVSGTSNYENYILKVRNTISTENAEKNQKPTQNWCVSCTSSIRLHHHHNQVASTVHEELAVICGVSRGSPMPYCKYEPWFVLEDSKLYTVLRQVHNN